MRISWTIAASVIGSLLLALYGAITVVYAKAAYRADGKFFSAVVSDSSIVLGHNNVSMVLPGGALLTGGSRTTGTLTWGFLKLPVSCRKNVGKLLMFLAAVCGVSVGAYVWREKIFDAWY